MAHGTGLIRVSPSRPLVAWLLRAYSSPACQSTSLSLQSEASITTCLKHRIQLTPFYSGLYSVVIKFTIVSTQCAWIRTESVGYLRTSGQRTFFGRDPQLVFSHAIERMRRPTALRSCTSAVHEHHVFSVKWHVDLCILYMLDAESCDSRCVGLCSKTFRPTAEQGKGRHPSSSGPRR